MAAVMGYPGGIQRHWLRASDGIKKAKAQLRLKLEKACEEQQESEITNFVQTEAKAQGRFSSYFQQLEGMEKTETRCSQKCTLIGQKATDTSHKKGISDDF